MPTTAVVATTPHYVLLDGNHRIGPKVVQVHTEETCPPIYGFSDKNAFYTFQMNSQAALTPYPLVTSYLRLQKEIAAAGLKLVVLDAAGPREPHLHAATLEAVLEALEDRRTVVTAAYELTLAPEDHAYLVKELLTAGDAAIGHGYQNEP